MNNDATLLQDFRSGDEAAFALLAERYHYAIRTTCQRQAPLGEVDDCVQAVFLVLARRPAMAARSPALLAWLHKVAHFVCRDARRAATRRHHTVTQAMRPPTTGHPPETAVLEQLDSALMCLEERQRAAVLLHASGSANDDIAQSLGISSGNASKLVQRGLAALRDRLCRSSTPIGAATVLTLFTTKQAAAAVTVPITLSSLNNASISATLLAKGTVMHLTVTATSTWIIAASLAATLCVGGVVAGKVLAQPPVSPPPTSVVVTPELSPVPILSDPKPVPVLSEWEKELDEKLSQKLVFNFVDTDPAELFPYLRQIIGINIIIHPNAEAKMKSTPITLTSKDLTARETLNQLMPMLHVRYLIIDQAVFITRLPEDDQGLFEKTEKSLAEDKVVESAEQTQEDKENLARLDQYVTLDFFDQSLVEVVVFFQHTTGINFILNQYIAARPPSVTMKVEAMKLRFVLNHLIRITNLRYQVRDEAIYITTPEIQKQAQALQLKPEVVARNVIPHLVKLRADGMLMKNVIKWLSEGSGVPIRVDPKLQKYIEQRATFDFPDSELLKILEFIAPLIGAEVKKIEEDGGGYLLTPKVPAADQEPVVPAAAQ